jgi:hypothetical protein
VCTLSRPQEVSSLQKKANEFCIGDWYTTGQQQTRDAGPKQIIIDTNCKESGINAYGFAQAVVVVRLI